MDKIDKTIINNAIEGLYTEYGYKVTETFYGSCDKRLTVVNESTEKFEVAMVLISDTLFVNTTDKFLFSVYLIKRFAKLLNLKISLLEI